MSYKPNTGIGNMFKSVYDTNDNGIVDVAASANVVEWANVSSKPSTFTPSAHTHAIADVTDLQTALDGKAPTITTAQDITQQTTQRTTAIKAHKS